MSYVGALTRIGRIFYYYCPIFNLTLWGGGSLNHNLAEIDPCATELCRCKKKILHTRQQRDDKTHKQKRHNKTNHNNDQDQKRVNMATADVMNPIPDTVVSLTHKDYFLLSKFLFCCCNRRVSDDKYP